MKRAGDVKAEVAVAPPVEVVAVKEEAEETFERKFEVSISNSLE
jgi:hypothetical protein